MAIAYRAFYYLEKADRHVPADAAHEMAKSDVRREILDNMTADGDFFGLFDADGGFFQAIFFADQDQFWVEVPVPKRKSSYGRMLDREELAALIDELPATFSGEAFPSFVLEAWD